MIEPKINKIDKSTFEITDKNNIVYGYIENYRSSEEEPLYFFHGLSKIPLSAQDLHQIKGLLDDMDNGNGIAIKIKNNICTASCLMFDGTNFEDIINLFPFGTALIEIMTHPDGATYQIYVEGADYSTLSNGTYVFRDEKDFSIYWLGSLDVHLQNGWEIVA